MAKTGRPTDYKKSYCEDAITLMSKGYSKEALAGHLSVCKQTLYTWIDKHPEFLDAIREGEAKSLLFWERMGIGGSMGKLPGFNANSWYRNMQNRHGWRDKQEIEQHNTGTETVKVTFV